jgi:hypothetical protein
MSEETKIKELTTKCGGDIDCKIVIESFYLTQALAPKRWSWFTKEIIVVRPSAFWGNNYDHESIDKAIKIIEAEGYQCVSDERDWSSSPVELAFIPK